MKAAKQTADGGIYAIKNLLSARSYVGQTINLTSRLSYHRSRLICGQHHNRVLQRDWNALGPEAFSFEVLSRFESEKEASMRHRTERLLIAATGAALSYNLLSADECKRADDGQPLMPRVIKLTAEQWASFDANGGMEALRKLIDRWRPK